jgi:hypothetical protein
MAWLSLMKFKVATNKFLCESKVRLTCNKSDSRSYLLFIRPTVPSSILRPFVTFP